MFIADIALYAKCLELALRCAQTVQRSRKELKTIPQIEEVESKDGHDALPINLVANANKTSSRKSDAQGAGLRTKSYKSLIEDKQSKSS